MVYLALKSLHILAAILWIGSLCLVTYVSALNKFESQQLKTVARFTEASIGVTWLAGILLVVLGSWYASSWWHIKVLLVIFISAIHTFLHRRWKSSDSADMHVPVLVPFLIILLTFIVVLLVVFKRPV